MQVWRLEAENGLGPYRCEGAFSINCPMERAQNKDTWTRAHQPTPAYDKKLSKSLEERGWSVHNIPDKDAWSFGFASLEQYFSWVPEQQSRKGLQAEKIKLKSFEVEREDFILGDTQVMFQKGKAKLLEVLDCDFEPVEEQKTLALERKVA